MLKFNDPVLIRIQDGIKKYGRIIAQARQRSMNARDTGDIVRAMLGDMFGYDPFFEVTAEIAVRSANADYAIVLEERVRFLVKVKPISIDPNAAHLLRLSGTSAPAYVNYILLTNADVWACYRLGVGSDRHAELVFRIAITDTTPLEEKSQFFYLLTKEGVTDNSLTRYWEQKRVLHPGRLAKLLLSEDVLNLLRREIKRTDNYRADAQTLRDILLHEVLRSDILQPHVLQRPDPPLPRLPQCFAYVHNPGDATSWRLPYRNMDGAPNAELLYLAAADLNSGFGIVDIPADDLPLVKQRLRAAYLELGVTQEELPDILRAE